MRKQQYHYEYTICEYLMRDVCTIHYELEEGKLYNLFFSFAPISLLFFFFFRSFCPIWSHIDREATACLRISRQTIYRFECNNVTVRLKLIFLKSKNCDKTFLGLFLCHSYKLVSGIE